MGKPNGFKLYKKTHQPYRSVSERVKDYYQIMQSWPLKAITQEAARCMDCGIPFCHHACPLGNLIPDWNDLVYREDWHAALDRLHATNNFPEFTGTLCPAPCEEACVLKLIDDSVGIKSIENAIIERAFEEGWVKPIYPKCQTRKKVAIIGSGPAGLAAAQQLNRVGHTVTVFERNDRIGGLLRYGIPDFKIEKRIVDRRLKLLEEEGIRFKVNADVGGNISIDDLRKEFDAILLATGANLARPLPLPGSELEGIHLAMDYLTLQNKLLAGDHVASISSTNKRVVVIGGGDTAADCIGTANRQGASSVIQFDIYPRLPDVRDPSNPWPEWSNVYRLTYALAEGGSREFSITTTGFSGENRVDKVHFINTETQEAQSLDVDLVIIAIGFQGPEKEGLLKQLQVRFTTRNTVWTDENRMTSQQGIFAAGDMERGQSIIVWAIADGRKAARAIDMYLMGSSELPS
jgi:glutamate synthase (NADPH/NADH) small chain